MHKAAYTMISTSLALIFILQVLQYVLTKIMRYTLIFNCIPRTMVRVYLRGYLAIEVEYQV